MTILKLAGFHYSLIFGNLEIEKHITTHYLCLLNREDVCVHARVCVCVFTEIQIPLGSLLLLHTCHMPDHFDMNVCVSVDVLLPVVWERSEAFPWQLSYWDSLSLCDLCPLQLIRNIKYSEGILNCLTQYWMINITLNVTKHYNFLLIFVF